MLPVKHYSENETFHWLLNSNSNNSWHCFSNMLLHPEEEIQRHSKSLLETLELTTHLETLVQNRSAWRGAVAKGDAANEAHGHRCSQEKACNAVPFQEQRIAFCRSRDVVRARIGLISHLCAHTSLGSDDT